MNIINLLIIYKKNINISMTDNTQTNKQKEPENIEIINTTQPEYMIHLPYLTNLDLNDYGEKIEEKHEISFKSDIGDIELNSFCNDFYMSLTDEKKIQMIIIKNNFFYIFDQIRRSTFFLFKWGTPLNTFFIKIKK